MLIVIVLWIVALCFILVTSIRLLKRRAQMKSCTASTTAVITEVKEKIIRQDGVSTREYVPVISYAIDGTTYARKYTKAYQGDTYHIGQTIDIQYDPRNPEKVNTLGASNKADKVMLIIGIVFGVIGVLIFNVPQLISLFTRS